MSSDGAGGHFPYLRFSFCIGDATINVEALLDTGFDGELVLLSRLIPVGSRPAAEVARNLGDGSGVVAVAYTGHLTIGPVDVPSAVAIVLGDEPLIGVQAIRHAVVTLGRGQRVTVRI